MTMGPAFTFICIVMTIPSLFVSLGHSENDHDLRLSRFIDQEDFVEDHEFVLLRMQRLIMDGTPSDMPSLRSMLQEEMTLNPILKSAWDSAASYYITSKREELYKTFVNSTVFLHAPDEYHIAIIAYTGNGLYWDFNSRTRGICWGKDIVLNYTYKAYAKILHLALTELGPEIDKHVGFSGANGPQFLTRYGGVPFTFKVGEKVAFQQFISTTWTNFSIPEDYKSSSVLSFNITKEHPLKYGVLVSYHSYYTSEDEVLISPLALFKVTNVSDVEYTLVTDEVPLETCSCPNPEVENVFTQMGEQTDLHPTVAFGLIMMLITLLFGIMLMTARSLLLYLKGIRRDMTTTGWNVNHTASPSPIAIIKLGLSYEKSSHE